MPLAEDNPSTHKYKNRVKEESSYTQLMSVTGLAGFSVLCYITHATAACADLISATPHAWHLMPASRLLPLAWQAVISSQSLPLYMLHAQGGASLR